MELKKYEENQKKTTSLFQMVPHVYIIDSLLCNSFIELQESKLQHLEKSKDPVNSPGHAKQSMKHNT